MSIFRKNTIFHTEEAMPDPDDLKIRFRRRVLLISFVGFLVILGFPVIREISAVLSLRHEARVFAEKLLETRLLASKNRAAVTIELSGDTKVWQRHFHSKNTGCINEFVGPSEQWSASEFQWQFFLQKETGETIAGHKICMNPQEGLILDSTPLGEGKLLVSVKNSLDGPQVAHLIVSNHGADIQSVTD